jgi:undecaprenyl phosphate N,N'-diacetylbacillosamine 1-phosphate transferase
MYKFFLKPLFDFIAAFFALILLSPILLIVFISLYFANDGKIFFYQLRPGLNKKIFKIVKFKTMNDHKDKNGNLLSDEKRLTKIGKFIRNSSLDELPQLINVLKGEMSIVGPRPLLPEYLQHYSTYQNRRHEVNPGITGWAQVNGRNAISWDKKFQFDVFYVDKISFLLDIKILFLTLKKIFSSNEIAADGHATMPRFDEQNNSK